MLAIDIMQLPTLGLRHVSRALEWVFLTVIPSFCLGQGLEDFYQNHDFLALCTQSYIRAGCAMNMTTPCCKGQTCPWLAVTVKQTNSRIR